MTTNWKKKKTPASSILDVGVDEFLFFFIGFCWFTIRLNIQIFVCRLAFGALSVCFINYIFSLFMQRSEGKETEGYSKTARIRFYKLGGYFNG